MEKKIVGRGDMPPTPKQLTAIARMCQALHNRNPLEEQVKSQAEAGRLIRELEAEIKFRLRRITPKIRM